MPPHNSHPPSLRPHKASGRGVVTLNGVDHYCGPWPKGKKKPPEETKAEYDCLVAEWLANGRRLPEKGSEPDVLTVGELIVRFWAHAEVYYRHPDGESTTELRDYRPSLKPLRSLYANLPAADFSPLKLKAVRENMILAGLSRNVINQRIGRIVRMFKWAVSEELVAETVYNALATVPGLQKGRSKARETKPVLPVTDAQVDGAMPFLSSVAQAMVQVQRLTGARPGEVCSMRPWDIDQTGGVWIYRPASHKTQHRGKLRAIAIGPKAQEMLRPFLDGRNPEVCVFSPQEAIAEIRAVRRTNRKSKVQPSQVCRKKRKPKRKPGTGYTVSSYLHAIKRACKRAGIEPWHPNQLRHSHATEVRKRFGLEAAQVALGHSQAQVTEVYAERDLTLAAKVAAEIG